MRIFAQLSDPQAAQSVGWFLLCIAAVCVVANQILSFYNSYIREKPSPSATYATKEEHREFRERMDVELGRERGSRKRMHEEMAALQADTHSLKESTQATTLQLSDLKRQIENTHARIDEIPQKTISLLNATKQLHG